MHMPCDPAIVHAGPHSLPAHPEFSVRTDRLRILWKQDSDSAVRGGAWESAFLMSSQTMVLCSRTTLRVVRPWGWWSELQLHIRNTWGAFTGPDALAPFHQKSESPGVRPGFSGSPSWCDSSVGPRLWTSTHSLKPAPGERRRGAHW